jgi:hypothetical protein
MKVTLTRLYDDYSIAQKVVRELEAAGLSSEDISIVANNTTNAIEAERKKIVDRDHDGVDDRTEAAGAGAGIGAVIAGGAGLLAGIGMIAIPGLGPVVAAGWLVSTALGAGAGAAAGAIIGALTQAGVPEEEAEVYVEGIRRGGTLVSARVPSEMRARYEAILDRSSVDIATRSEAYRNAGWKGFDPKADPYTADQIRSERNPPTSVGW